MEELTDPEGGSHQGLAAHWDSTYLRRGSSRVSWFQAEPAVSLDLIVETGISREAAVIDVGGGASSLVDRLIYRSFADVSVLDISSVAIDEARRRLPADAPVAWVVQDGSFVAAAAPLRALARPGRLPLPGLSTPRTGSDEY